MPPTKALNKPQDPKLNDCTSGEIDALVRQFPPPYRRELRRLIRTSGRLADLARTFPGAMVKMATPRTPLHLRLEARELVDQGAPHKSVARLLDLPLWLRRLPPDAFMSAPSKLPNGTRFARRIVNCLPKSRAESSLWLRAVTFASEAVDEDFAVWLAAQPVFAGRGDPTQMFALLSAYAWLSRNPNLASPASPLMVPWRPEMAIDTALCAAKSWLNRIRLILQLQPGGITDPWLESGEARGFHFTPLLTAEDLLNEARAMRNCADQYADKLARDRCRLFSVTRPGGGHAATVEIAQHHRETGFLAISQLKGRHNMPAGVDVWQAAHQWLATQPKLRRLPVIPEKEPAMDQKTWTRIMAPYRKAKDGARWLPEKINPAAMRKLETDLTDLARRAGVRSWLFT